MTTLRLTVTSAPPDSPLLGQQLDIGVAGATLGRGAGNQWVLPDSERIVSSSHASIAHELGQFVITDHSTNGTFVNGSPSPLGLNNSTPLQAGDSVAMGKYLFTVEVLADKSPPPAGGSFLDELGATPGAVTPGASTPGASTPVDSAPSPPAGGDLDDLDKWLEPAAEPQPEAPLWGAANVVQATPDYGDEQDPLAAIERAQRSDSPQGGWFDADPAGAPADDDPDWWKGSRSDHGDPLQQAFDGPRGPAPADFAAEPTPVPPRVKDDLSAASPLPAAEPAVDDADDLDALLGLGDDPAPAPAAPDPFDSKPAASTAPAAEADMPDWGEPPGEATGVMSPPPEPPADVASGPVPAAESTPVPEPAKPQVAAGAPSAPPVSSVPGGNTAVAGDTAQLLAQMLELGNLDATQLDNLTPEVVAVLKTTIGHLLELLRARSSIKNELRLDRTMIQPVENNPLKFALTERDALRYLFGEHSGAYMSGTRAVTEAFNDIAGHQMALLAGMRSAYEKMLAQFDPAALEQRLGQAGGKALLGGKKARLWDAYVEYFDKLQQDPETSFNRLFGEEFANAYEDQVAEINSGKGKA